MQFTFFAVRDIWNIFQKTIDFVENLEMTHVVRIKGNHVICVIMTRYVS